MDRLAAFNAAKQVFLGIVNQHGPVLGVNDTWVNPFFQQVVDDLKKLDAVDRLFEATEQKNTNNRTAEVLKNLDDILGQYTQPNTQFRQHAVAAVQNLQNGINNSKAARPGGVAPNANRNTAIEKYITGLKVLKTSLDAVSKNSDAWLQKSRSMVAGFRGQVTMAEQFRMNFRSALKAAVARGLAAAQKMKASPNQATYDHEMDHGSRDIQAQLVLANKNTNAVPNWQTWHVANPAPHLAAILPYAQGNRRIVPNNTPEATIRQWISDFNQAVKAIQAAYP